MDNHSYSSYADSGDSSPLSREIDCDNASWDESPASNYRVKFMCSYGGKISPRPHDNQLSYVGGDTKILTVDRNIRFPAIFSKLSSLLLDTDVCFKYQLPGEDLDALISVTNDEDLDHMMLEYDRLHRASAKPARLRLFLFPLNPNPPPSPPSSDAKSDRQWFVDALNSPPMQAVEVSAAAAAADQDFLFGFDKVGVNLPETVTQLAVPEASSPPISDSGKEDRVMGREFEFSTDEIQRQIQGLQRMQIAGQEQPVMFQDENVGRTLSGHYYPQNAVPPPQPTAVPMGAAYWPEKQMQPLGGFPAASATGADHPVYVVSMPAYRPPGHGYYVQRVVPQGVYQETPMYGVGPPPAQKMAPYGDGVVRPQEAGVAEAAGGGYTGVGYDRAGRLVYYNAPLGMMPTYQTVTASSVDPRQVTPAGALSQVGKVLKPQSS